MKKILLLCITLCVVFASCSDKSEDFTISSSLDERSVEMAFDMPLLSTTSVQVSDEAVAELDLVVFKNNKYEYTRSAYTSEYAKFRSTLKIDSDLDIYFFANSRSILTDNILSEGASWEEVQSRLLVTYSDTVIGGKKVLPMWGRLHNVSISDQVVNNLGKVELLRSVASANVIFKEPTGLPFEPYKAYVYYGADKGFIAPEEDNLTFTPQGKVSGVEVPVSPVGFKTNKVIEVGVEDNAFASLYMLENATSSNENGNKRTRIVIGLYLDGSDDPTYYPLDIFKKDTNDLDRVRRNSQYNLFITAVNGEGYPTPGEAAEGIAVNLNYEVVVWDQNNHDDIAIDGVNYLSVSKKKATLYRHTGSKTNIYLTGTFTKEDITLNLTNSLNGTPTVDGDAIENDRYRVELTGAGTNLTLTVIALKDYSETNPSHNTDVLKIQAGRIEFEVVIEQLTSTGWNNGGNEEIEF